MSLADAPRHKKKNEWQMQVEKCKRSLQPEGIRNLISSRPVLEGMKAIAVATDGHSLSTSRFSEAEHLI